MWEVPYLECLVDQHTHFVVDVGRGAVFSSSLCVYFSHVERSVDIGDEKDALNVVTSIVVGVFFSHRLLGLMYAIIVKSLTVAFLQNSFPCRL